MTRNQWRTLLGGVAAVTVFLVAQPDELVPPAVKLVAGIVNVFVAAVLNPPAKGD